MMVLGSPALAARAPFRGWVVRRLALTATLLVAGAGPLPAQVATADTSPAADRAFMTRRELEALAASVERAAARGGGDQQRVEAAAIRERLRQGDFRVGDKITLRTASSLTLPQSLAEPLNATHTLREGKVLRLPNIPDLSLQGVLRSELDSVVNTHLARTLRSVQVHAEPLMQVLVSGPAQKPGYQNVTPDMTITDVIMGVAVPAGNVDMRRTVVKRDGRQIISRDSLQRAIKNGATLDRIDFRSGDELALGERQARNWMSYLQIVSVVTSVVFLALQLRNL